MSAFEVNLTPTRFKAIKRNESREPTFVIMAPFSAKAIVTFEDIPVTKSAKRILRIHNPSDSEIHVMVTRSFSPEHNISLEWTSNDIPAQCEIQMELAWSPMKEVACKETLQLTDNRNFKKDVMVILKSVANKPKATVKRFPNISSGTNSHVKTLRLKSPTSSKTSSVVPQHKRQTLSEKYKTEKAAKFNQKYSSPLREANKREAIRKSVVEPKIFQMPLESPVAEKENASPLTPGQVSSLFDNIQFTPATETRPKGTSTLDYLASLPTPVNRPHPTKGDGLLRNIQPRRLDVVDSPEAAPKPPQIVLPEEEMPRVVVNNKTFDLRSDDIESFMESSHDNVEQVPERAVLDKTTTLLPAVPRPLAVIKEEDSSPTPGDKLKRDVNLVGTPLRKYSESMLDLSTAPKTKSSSIGSMPNLNEIEKIPSIEMNRYFNSKKLTPVVEMEKKQLNTSDSGSSTNNSHVELAFNQSEILAQSSRFNLHEVGQKSRRNSPIMFQRGSSPSAAMFFKQEPMDGSPGTSPFNSPELIAKSKRIRKVSCLDSPSESLSVPKISYMTVSPPKRAKVEADTSFNTTRGTGKWYKYNSITSTPGGLQPSMPPPPQPLSSRSNKWPQVQPKSKMSKTLSLVKKPITPRKVKEKPRVMLYDSDLYLQQCINPDPFAASTTCDPFLASTMYLDERSVDKHEADFKKWLNALVSMPAELDPDCSQKIDVGRLFNEVRNKELILAPTKEEQSMNFLTKSRMDSLRRAAVSLFLSEEMRAPCSKVAVYVNKGAIRIRTDRNLHLDVVMQRYILELLLCFNPLWLRIGLEVVFGEIVHLHSNSDVVGLSTFVLNRLFKDKFLEQKYSKAYTLSDEYADHIKKFTLQKFLTLLLFLDKAKTHRIIKHNPCLFVKQSKYKEVKEILLRFSSELLANVGDITRDLKRLGYALSHKQNFLDEFDYAFSNLAVDLRDGVRLTRVMEIILLRDDMSQQLRVPAISRLQRIYNVNLGLKALAEADFELRGNITAADIVDGHREKTLSLLWQIIYKFRSPKFHAAAKVIQSWWRNSWLKVVIQRRIRVKEEIRRSNAATVIQSAFRGYISRKYAEVYKAERTQATVCLQKFVRGFLARRHFAKMVQRVCLVQRWYRATKLAQAVRSEYLYIRENVVFIQCWYRRIQLARKIEALAPFVRQLQEEARIKHEAALVIQRCLKSVVICKRLRSAVLMVVDQIRKSKKEYRCAASIQSFFKMAMARRKFLEKRMSAMLIQRFWLAHKLVKLTREEFVQKKQAIIAIQRFYRGYKLTCQLRGEFLRMQSAAIAIQRRFRANKIGHDQRREFIEMKRAAIVIQQRFRATQIARKERETYLKFRERIITIQRRVRATRDMWREKSKFVQMKTAATTIQRMYRSRLQMKSQLAKYQQTRWKVILIQRKWRATLLARKVRMEFVTLQYNVICVQQRFRANRLMKHESTQYQRLRQASIVVQRQFRAKIAGRIARKDFVEKRTAAISIQRFFRSYSEMKFVRAKFNGTRQAVIFIQQHFRAYLQMKKDRQAFLDLKRAAILVQRRYRSRKMMQIQRAEYLQMRNCVIFIQQRYRALLAMKKERAEYERKLGLIVAIQRRFRAKLLGKHVREEYETTRQVIVYIQQRFRAKLKMRRCRTDYKETREKITKIQNHFRSYLEMKRQRSDFLMRRNSVTKIQTWYRSIQLMRQERASLQHQVQCVLVLQRRIRATIAMRKQRDEYLRIQRSTVTIQRGLRAHLQMKDTRDSYLQLRDAAIVVQGRWRAIVEMRKIRSQYLLVRSLVICIQRKFRANRAMKTQRTQFLRLKSAATFVQRHFRGKLETRMEREKFLQLRELTKKLQAHTRGYLARQRFTAMMTPEKRLQIKQRQAAKVIQRFWRGYRVRKRWQNTKLGLIRKNIKLLNDSTKAFNTVAFRLKESVKILRGRYCLTDYLKVLMYLDRISRTVPNVVMFHSTYISTFCYGIMAQACRSECDKQLIELCSRVILNLARYNSTTANTFQEGGLATVAQMLLRWCDKDCDIFNTLCTLIWVFAHCPIKRQKIRAFMTTPEAIYVVRETKKLVARKEKMKKNVRKPTVFTSNNRINQGLVFPPRALPNLEPDYGVVRTKPYIFVSSVFAFETILCKLGIEII